MWKLWLFVACLLVTTSKVSSLYDPKLLKVLHSSLENRSTSNDYNLPPVEDLPNQKKAFDVARDVLKHGKAKDQTEVKKDSITMYMLGEESEPINLELQFREVLEGKLALLEKELLKKKKIVDFCVVFDVNVIKHTGGEKGKSEKVLTKGKSEKPDKPDKPYKYRYGLAIILEETIQEHKPKSFFGKVVSNLTHLPSKLFHSKHKDAPQENNTKAKTGNTPANLQVTSNAITRPEIPVKAEVPAASGTPSSNPEDQNNTRLQDTRNEAWIKENHPPNKIPSSPKAGLASNAHLLREPVMTSPQNTPPSPRTPSFKNTPPSAPITSSKDTLPNPPIASSEDISANLRAPSPSSPRPKQIRNSEKPQLPRVEEPLAEDKKSSKASTTPPTVADPTERNQESSKIETRNQPTQPITTNIIDEFPPSPRVSSQAAPPSLGTNEHSPVDVPVKPSTYSACSGKHTSAREDSESKKLQRQNAQFFEHVVADDELFNTVIKTLITHIEPPQKDLNIIRNGENQALAKKELDSWESINTAVVRIQQREKFSVGETFLLLKMEGPGEVGTQAGNDEITTKELEVMLRNTIEKTIMTLVEGRRITDVAIAKKVNRDSIPKRNLGCEGSTERIPHSWFYIVISIITELDGSVANPQINTNPTRRDFQITEKK